MGLNGETNIITEYPYVITKNGGENNYGYITKTSRGLAVIPNEGIQIKIANQNMQEVYSLEDRCRLFIIKNPLEQNIIKNNGGRVSLSEDNVINTFLFV